MINGGHVVVANDSANVVDKIRTEKVALLRRVRQGVARSRLRSDDNAFIGP